MQLTAFCTESAYTHEASLSSEMESTSADRQEGSLGCKMWQDVQHQDNLATQSTVMKEISANKWTSAHSIQIESRSGNGL